MLCCDKAGTLFMAGKQTCSAGINMVSQDEIPPVRVGEKMVTNPAGSTLVRRSPLPNLNSAGGRFTCAFIRHKQWNRYMDALLVFGRK